MRPSIPSAGLLCPLLLLGGGCGWVDSTGRQEADPGRAGVTLEEALPGSAIAIDEQTAERRLPVSVGTLATAEDAYAWSTVEGAAAEARANCAGGIEDFRDDIAVATLAEACTDPEDCALAFERDAEAGEGRVEFTLRVPSLRAPVAVRRELGLEAADGTSSSALYDFCLISINEAPEANDDGLYVLRAGETLTVTADSPDSLLANDRDDLDAANRPLAIETNPVRAPNSAAAFELRSDGGFTYTARDSGILNFISDSFEYRVGDGTFTVEAIARLRVEAGNAAPVLEEDPPPLTATVGEPFAVDLSVFFSDPDGDALRFSAPGEQLPPSGAIALGLDDGVLGGTPLDEDVGDYAITIVASDAERETRAVVSLSIVAPPNRAPEYIEGTVDDVTVGVFERVRIPAPQFVDEDGDPLVYELDGELPNALTLDPETGVISGITLERGRFNGLRIRATDPDGESARSDRFTILVTR